MIRIDQVKTEYTANEETLLQAVCKKLKIEKKAIKDFYILKKSIDARKKPLIYFVYTIIVTLSNSDENKVLARAKKDNNINKYKNEVYKVPTINTPSKDRPLIIGAGPAGLFAAYILALNHLNPIIFERGKKVDERTHDILKFWETGILDTASNVQFGEGGAGTFSDGKLNTLVNDKVGRNKFVLETFVKFGAPSNILYDYKPHIGTDILKLVISNMRNEIINLGGEFKFNTKVDELIIQEGKIAGVKAAGNTFNSTNVILAIGHSARDTFSLLSNQGISMEAKDFAVGFRIEHPQEMISKVMYANAYKDGASTIQIGSKSS